MLKTLTIKNVALIDKAEINFGRGLNILSGETGSGKSVILEALNFVLGAKADKSLIKSGEKDCLVTAEFSVKNDDIITLMEDLGLEREETLVITRKLDEEGKSTIKVNGATFSVSMLKKLTSKLVDVHGQSEHFFLLKNSNQLELIDKFTVNAEELKNEIKAIQNKRKQVVLSLNELGNEEERLVKADILSYQIKEIESAELKEGEEEELIVIEKALINQEKILTALSGVKAALTDDGGVSDIIGSAERSISGITAFGESYSALYDRLSNLSAETSDICDAVTEEIDKINYGEYDLNTVSARLDVIKTVKRKYGGSVKAVLDFYINAKKQLNDFTHYDELYAEYTKQKFAYESEIYEKYVILSNKRREAAKLFSKNVEKELLELGMKGAKFNVVFADLPSISDCDFTSTIDRVEFSFSANVGEPEKPLAEVISGGEISRFMLAIKTQTARFNDINTCIFDEIDAGISGNTAKIVAQKFAKIALNTQLIAITHLPQISAMGDKNLLIEKTVENGKTLTRVTELNDSTKIAEIVRLTGGDELSVSAKTLAEELIASSNKYKEGLR